MIEHFGPPLLAFLLASVVVSADLLTKRFPRTAFLLWSPRRCWALWAYGIIYGIIAAILTAVLSYLIDHHVLHVAGLGLDNAWIRAIYVGLFTKPFLQFDLFAIGEARFGFAQIAQLFEPQLVRVIEVREDDLVKEYLRPYIEKYPTTADARKRIIEDIPDYLPETERKAFELDIRLNVTGSPEAMRMTLRKLGRGAIRRIFPLT